MAVHRSGPASAPPGAGPRQSGAVLSDPGRIRYDPQSRRRVRRAGARLRPLLLPLAVLLSTVVLTDRLLGSGEPAVPVDVGPSPPAGSVLVAVSPTDPAVLALATPGSSVDVYAAGTAGPGPPVAGTVPGPPARAVLLVSAALVVAPPVRAPTGPGDGGGLIAPGATGGAGSAGSAVTLAVDDTDAAVLAEHTGGGFVLAVRAGSVGGSGVTRPGPGG